MIVQKLAITKKPAVDELDDLLEEEFEEVVRMVPQHQLELYGAGGRIDDSLSSASPASSSSSPYQLEDNNSNFVFGSQLVDKNSITPYSDATQVSSLHFSYSLSLPLLLCYELSWAWLENIWLRLFFSFVSFVGMEMEINNFLKETIETRVTEPFVLQRV